MSFRYVRFDKSIWPQFRGLEGLENVIGCSDVDSIPESTASLPVSTVYGHSTHLALVASSGEAVLVLRKVLDTSSDHSGGGAYSSSAKLTGSVWSAAHNTAIAPGGVVWKFSSPIIKIWWSHDVNSHIFIHICERMGYLHTWRWDMGSLSWSACDRVTLCSTGIVAAVCSQGFVAYSEESNQYSIVEFNLNGSLFALEGSKSRQGPAKSPVRDLLAIPEGLWAIEEKGLTFYESGCKQASLSYSMIPHCWALEDNTLLWVVDQEGGLWRCAYHQERVVEEEEEDDQQRSNNNYHNYHNYHSYHNQDNNIGYGLDDAIVEERVLLMGFYRGCLPDQQTQLQLQVAGGLLWLCSPQSLHILIMPEVSSPQDIQVYQVVAWPAGQAFITLQALSLHGALLLTARGLWAVVPPRLADMLSRLAGLNHAAAIALCHRWQLPREAARLWIEMLSQSNSPSSSSSSISSSLPGKDKDDLSLALVGEALMPLLEAPAALLAVASGSRGHTSPALQTHLSDFLSHYHQSNVLSRFLTHTPLNDALIEMLEMRRDIGLQKQSLMNCHNNWHQQPPELMSTTTGGTIAPQLPLPTLSTLPSATAAATATANLPSTIGQLQEAWLAHLERGSTVGEKWEFLLTRCGIETLLGPAAWTRAHIPSCLFVGSAHPMTESPHPLSSAPSTTPTSSSWGLSFAALVRTQMLIAPKTLPLLVTRLSHLHVGPDLSEFTSDIASYYTKEALLYIPLPLASQGGGDLSGSFSLYDHSLNVSSSHHWSDAEAATGEPRRDIPPWREILLARAALYALCHTPTHAVRELVAVGMIEEAILFATDDCPCSESLTALLQALPGNEKVLAAVVYHSTTPSSLFDNITRIKTFYLAEDANSSGSGGNGNGNGGGGGDRDTISPPVTASAAVTTSAIHPSFSTGPKAQGYIPFHRVKKYLMPQHQAQHSR
jgi:hypothetical protein